MPFIDDIGTEGSSFVWTIQNFSYCLQKPGEYLESPRFILDIYEEAKWRLVLCSRGEKEANFSESQNTLAIGLIMEDASTPTRKVELAFSIRTTKGSFKRMLGKVYNFERKVSNFERTLTALGHPDFLKREELRGKGSETYLDNDTMILKCRILKIDGKPLPPGQCYGKTMINVERTTNIWSLEKFRQSMSSCEIAEKQPISSEIPSLVTMKFILYRKDFSGDRIKLEIEQTDKNKRCFLTCDITLFEAGGKIFHSVRDECRFDASEVSQIWTIPYIPLSNILDCEEPYLRCELAVSSGSEYSWVERAENGKVEDQQPSSSNLKKEQDCSDSWKDDLLRFYSNGMFTDMTIRTQSKDFAVHKAILCARSTVFHAMFERDMKEKRTGVVDIVDIDDDTVHRMLLFVYSDTVEDLDCDVASKLYFAADKYRIMALRRRCSDFLKENLGVSNVCEVFVIANMHQDEDLKLFVQDFFIDHVFEVMHSVEWDRFKQDHLPLASEMINKLCLRNGNLKLF